MHAYVLMGPTGASLVGFRPNAEFRPKSSSALPRRVMSNAFALSCGAMTGKLVEDPPWARPVFRPSPRAAGARAALPRAMNMMMIAVHNSK